MRNQQVTTACKPQYYVPLPDGISISDRLKGMLISSVACGDAELAARITENFDVIQCLGRIDSCSGQDVQLLRIQVALAEFAMDAARSKIDQVKLRVDGTGETHFRGSNYRDAEAMKRSQGTSEFKSRANSQNNFARTSRSRESSFSTSRASADGSFSNIGNDLSNRQQNSSTTSYDKAKVTGEGEGAGTSTFSNSRTSYAKTGTSPNPIVDGIFPFTTTELLLTIVGPEPALKFTFFSPITDSPICSDINLNLNPDDPPSDLCNNLTPSTGRGIRTSFRGNYTFTVSVPIPFVGVASLSAGYEISYNKSYHDRIQMVCSVGGGKVLGASRTTLNYRQDDDMSSSGETRTTASGLDQHRITRDGRSLRTSTSKLHAESHGAMDSCGESHSFSRRKAHGESQNTGESTSRMEQHSETRTVFQSVSKLIAESKYFNQIFKQLADLRKLLWNDLMRVEDRARASRPAVAFCPSPRILKAPPLFWFSNALTCSSCFGRVANGRCGCSGR